MPEGLVIVLLLPDDKNRYGIGFSVDRFITYLSNSTHIVGSDCYRVIFSRKTSWNFFIHRFSASFS